jgi:hypothetical protein
MKTVSKKRKRGTRKDDPTVEAPAIQKHGAFPPAPWWQRFGWTREVGVQRQWEGDGNDAYIVRVIDAKGKLQHHLAVVFIRDYRTDKQAKAIAEEIAARPDMINALRSNGGLGILDRRSEPRDQMVPMMWEDPWELPAPPCRDDPPYDDHEYWDAYEEAMPLAAAVNLHLRADHPLKVIFNHAFPESGLDGETVPTLEAIYTAIGHFAKLPAEEQRRLLNGWHYEPPWERGGRADVLKAVDEGQVRVFLEVEVRRAHLTELSTDSTNAVRVYIARGTDLETAKNELSRILEDLPHNWTRYIANTAIREFEFAESQKAN